MQAELQLIEPVAAPPGAAVGAIAPIWFLVDLLESAPQKGYHQNQTEPGKNIEEGREIQEMFPQLPQKCINTN